MHSHAACLPRALQDERLSLDMKRQLEVCLRRVDHRNAQFYSHKSALRFRRL